MSRNNKTGIRWDVWGLLVVVLLLLTMVVGILSVGSDGLRAQLFFKTAPDKVIFGDGAVYDPLKHEVFFLGDNNLAIPKNLPLVTSSILPVIEIPVAPSPVVSVEPSNTYPDYMRSKYNDSPDTGLKGDIVNAQPTQSLGQRIINFLGFWR